MDKDDVVIFSYTRAQAIADGVLIDVSELAKQAGFRFPVALTCGVWAECIAGTAGIWAECVPPNGVQDETRRVWGLIHALWVAVTTKSGSERVDFAVHVRNDDCPGDPPLVRLYALCGPGDDAEPVITVMLPHED